MAAAMRRRLRLAGADVDAERHGARADGDDAGATSRRRARSSRCAPRASSACSPELGRATDAVLRFAGLRDRFELVLSAQDAGATSSRTCGRTGRRSSRRGAGGNEVCMVSTHWWDVAAAKRAGLRTGWVARRERSLLRHAFRRPTTPAATWPRWPRRIVTRMAA